MIVKRLKKDFSILDNKLIAHKGIYGYYSELNRNIKGNTFESCKLAIDNNIPFECDVRNTADNIAILAHDNNMYNGNGKKIKISECTYKELCDMFKEKVPAKLEDVLKYNNGRVGVIVDAKEAHIFYSKYRDNIAKLLNEYAQKGEVMLQSFNPFFMLTLRKHLKGVLTRSTYM